MLESQLVIKKDEGEFVVDFNKIKKTSLILRALNHKLRRVMIETILKKPEGITVTELYMELRLEQSVASQHLAILRTAGIVKTKRKGKQIFYSLNIEKIEKIVTTIEHMV